MPLPPALLAKLAKRGIIKVDPPKEPTPEKELEPEEKNHAGMI